MVRARCSGAASTTLQPVSRFWPAPANVMPVNAASWTCARPGWTWGTGSPHGCRTLPEIHSIAPPSSHARALGVEVVHVLRPVLDGRVAQVRVLADEQLHSARVQVRHVVLRRAAALDEVQVGAVFHDDERVLELARALRVQAEVALQREVELGALRHVHEASRRTTRRRAGRRTCGRWAG